VGGFVLHILNCIAWSHMASLAYVTFTITVTVTEEFVVRPLQLVRLHAIRCNYEYSNFHT